MYMLHHEEYGGVNEMKGLNVFLGKRNFAKILLKYYDRFFSFFTKEKGCQNM